MNNKLIVARALWKNVVIMKPVKQPQEFAGLCFEDFCSLVLRPEKKLWGLLEPLLLVSQKELGGGELEEQGASLFLHRLEAPPTFLLCRWRTICFFFCVTNVSQIKPKLVEVCSFSGMFWGDATLLLLEGSSAFSPVWKMLFLSALFRVLLHILINGGITWPVVE